MTLDFQTITKVVKKPAATSSEAAAENDKGESSSMSILLYSYICAPDRTRTYTSRDTRS